jgi:hypothetical protein
MVIEVGSLVLLLRQGGFAFRVTAVTLLISVAVSWAAAHYVGLAGAAMGSVLGVYLDRVLLLRRVSRLTGIALRDLQDWGGLIRPLALAAGCAALAWFLVERFLPGAGPMTRVAAGATVLALAYAPIQFRRRKA